VALREYERFVERGTGQGRRDGFYDLKDQPFLGHEAFVENVHRNLYEQPQFVYDIPLAEIVSEVSSALDISTDFLCSPNRNREGALGRAVVGYVGRKLGGHQIRRIAEHFKRDPVVMSQGTKRLEDKLGDGEGFAKTISNIERSLIRNSSRRILI
jgi:chromosomal replication initiation ATPase DnaA